ncbi:hypothetical protein C8A05DRAFT_38054 [Staphylotrichum tortipilum]|uniref:Uncharacterized protein n=1 Tax=Staphylotrichum tortipilum TaxID=2831512 RepID=A0AAN6MEA0_9PEZI|nr:hypothetical protein C8A05DRAFT_38054 [Staphylotrichum longicolle]
MNPRHIIDISASSPIQWRAKSKQEKEELEEEYEDEGVEMLLPGPAATGMEKRRTRGKRWCRRLWKCFVVVLWVVVGLVAVAYNKMSGDLYLAKRGLLEDRTEEVHHPDLKRHADHCFRYLR